MNIFKKKGYRKYEYLIDFCKNYVKIIRSVQENHHSQRSQGKSFVIDKIFTLNLKELSEDKINNFFSRLLPSKDNYNLVSFITRKDTTIKYIKLPSTSPDEIDNMVEFQIEKEIPYPTLKISFDYQIQSVDTKGYSYVMVVIAYKKRISNIIDNLKNYGLDIDSIVLDIDALCNWYNFTHGILDRPIGLVDIDLDKVNLVVIKSGKIDFSRCIPIGYVDFYGGNNKYVITKLVDEVIRSIGIYEKDNITNVKEIKITGAEGVFRHLRRKLEQTYSGKVETKSCFEDVPLALTSEKLKKQGSQLLSFSYLIGGTLPFQQKKFEFLPHQLRIKKELRLKKNVMKKIGIAFIFLSFVSVAIIMYRFYVWNEKLSLVNNYLKKITPEVEKVKQEVSLMRKLSGYLQNRNFSLNILKQVYDRIPDSILLTHLELSRNENLILRGEAKKISDVFSFVSSLEKSSYFSKVNADNVNVNQRKDEEIVSFEIYCKVK